MCFQSDHGIEFTSALETVEKIKLLVLKKRYFGFSFSANVVDNEDQKVTKAKYFIRDEFLVSILSEFLKFNLRVLHCLKIKRLFPSILSVVTTFSRVAIKINNGLEKTSKYLVQEQCFSSCFVCLGSQLQYFIKPFYL